MARILCLRTFNSSLYDVAANKAIIICVNKFRCSRSAVLRLAPLTDDRALLQCFSNRFFKKFYYVGLGYRFFKRFNKLIIWLGKTHFFVTKIPALVRVLIKKKKLYLLSPDLASLNCFTSVLNRIRRSDVYKGKGLLHVKRAKGFMKMKIGKKKQY